MTRFKGATSKWILPLILILPAILLKLFSLDPLRVEKLYSTGWYPSIGRVMRQTFGPLPFSFGDLLYLVAILLLVRNLIRLLMGLREIKNRNVHLKNIIINTITILLLIYLYFNLAWGLNYDRLGIAYQMGLEVRPNDTAGLRQLADKLLHRTNENVFPERRPDNRSVERLKAGAMAGYDSLSRTYSFLTYRPGSVKASLFGELGNYIGYTGYYNPFTAEAQVNTRVPDFLQPFVACHEIAHQLGYARENEANFVGFLAARRSADPAFRYSAYFDMFLYANAALYGMDSAAARRNLAALAPQARRDITTLRAFREKYRSPIEDLTDLFYDRFLRLNRQPEGTATYGQVVMWLLALEAKEGDL